MLSRWENHLVLKGHLCGGRLEVPPFLTTAPEIAPEVPLASPTPLPDIFLIRPDHIDYLTGKTVPRP